MTADRQIIPIKFLEKMLVDGLIDKKQFETLRIKLRTMGEGKHPIAGVASLNLKHANQPHQTLTDEFLTEWFANKCGMSYVFIDPLKIDVDSVTSVMSKAFAQRHKIIAYDVNDTTVTIATAEPGVKGWMNGLQHAVRKDIKRVMANPVAIERYQREFYA